MRKFLNFENIIDLVYRQKKICYVCEEYNPFIKKNICGRCKSEYSLHDKAKCNICGRKIELKENAIDIEHSCYQCIGSRNVYDKGISVFDYRKRISRLIVDFKYEGEMYLKDFFAYEMSERLKSNDIYREVDFIVSVPMSKGKLKKRGYNQADILANLISESLDIPYEDSIIIKLENESSQKGLSRLQRMRNIKDSFIIDKEKSNSIFGKNILIIDDVYTTGTTINEVSRVLKEKNADKVYFLTLASTPFE